MVRHHGCALQRFGDDDTVAFTVESGRWALSNVNLDCCHPGLTVRELMDRLEIRGELRGSGDWVLGGSTCLGSEQYCGAGDVRAELARLGGNLNRVDVLQREAHNVHGGQNRGDGGHPDEHWHMTGVAEMQVADAHLVADARRELVVVKEGVHFLNFGAAECLNAQAHSLCCDCPWRAPNQRWAHAPPQAATLEAAHAR